MKKIISSGLVASAALLAFAFVSLKLTPLLFPNIAEQYYSPTFINESGRNAFYYVHPIILAFSLAWFWNRFKDILNGNYLLKGLELGFVYLMIATLPGMVMIFSAIDVPTSLIVTWLVYGFLQATIAGIIFARMHV
jgi:hypothetical protein